MLWSITKLSLNPSIKGTAAPEVTTQRKAPSFRQVSKADNRLPLCNVFPETYNKFTVEET